MSSSAKPTSAKPSSAKAKTSVKPVVEPTPVVETPTPVVKAVAPATTVKSTVKPPVFTAVHSAVLTLLSEEFTKFKATVEGIENVPVAVVEAIDKLLADYKVSTKSKKAKKDPNAEKKAPSPYNLFVKETMALLKETEPNLDKKLKMTRIGQLWSERKNKK